MSHAPLHRKVDRVGFEPRTPTEGSQEFGYPRLSEPKRSLLRTSKGPGCEEERHEEAVLEDPDFVWCVFR